MRTIISSNISKSKSSAFTLIELLIVIVIIAILASVAFPVTALVMEQARKAEAKNEVTNLVNAIKMYELEYGKLPFQAGEGGESDLEMDTFQDNIISVLAGYNVDGLNPRLKPFYEGKTAKNPDSQKPAGGMFGTDEQLQLADPWGNEYFITIDSNYDNIIQDLPGAEGDDVRTKVAVWTKGKERNPGEFEEVKKWIKSWSKN
ncbi:MAG: type II secretion system protein [Verrucomicrobiales bacterium]